MEPDNRTHLEKLKSYYEDGFSTGRYDARIGLSMKLVSSVLRIRSAFMKEWERGYVDGYFKALEESATNLGRHTTSSGTL